MASSLLEELRSRQEEIEIAEDAIAHILKLKKQIVSSNNSKNAENNEVTTLSKSSQLNKLIYEHAIKLILIEIKKNAVACLNIINDQDGMRKEENAYLAGLPIKKEKNSDQTATASSNSSTSNPGSASYTDIWQRYYDRIKNIKTANKKYQLKNFQTDIKTLENDPNPHVTVAEQYIMSALEIYGYEDLILNLNDNFNEFLNLNKIKNCRIAQFRATEVSRLKKKGLSPEEITLRNIDDNFQEIDYVNYLQKFHCFDDIERYCKYGDDNYERYLTNLSKALIEFFEKMNPLALHSVLYEKLEEEFQGRWDNKDLDNWVEPTYMMPLYCKVTDKLFASQTVYDYHKKGKKYKNKLARMMTIDHEEQKKLANLSLEKDKKLAKGEFLIARFSDILADHIRKCIEDVQKKQSKTAEELNQSDESGDEKLVTELSHIDEKQDINDDEDEKPIYNPLNLPLGWDGKPIAYWLYKLHGLGIEYKCEICGNYSYWGRRAFEKHFQEWRHSFGMRCLRIPNTVHFKEITKIEDAITLYEKLKKDTDSHTFRSEYDVECEDSEGNAMSIRDYNDLLKQGLL